MHTLNEVYSSLSARRRYEVWFLRMALADGRGALWLRYLLMNPGRGGCSEISRGMPVQVWATWFPANGTPQSLIQGFPLDGLELSARGRNPFYFRFGENAIEQNSCRGALNLDGHQIAWNLHYRSSFRVTLSNKGWIGFSCTPHSDAHFSGEITFDDRRFSGDRLAFGLQGHNCGYRHRGCWRWAHVYFPRPGASPSTLEALIYDMPFGMIRSDTSCEICKGPPWDRLLATRAIFDGLSEAFPKTDSTWRRILMAPAPAFIGCSM
jgi:hypothetical protein